jgi:uncharacterized low-complexity protein
MWRDQKFALSREAPQEYYCFVSSNKRLTKHIKLRGAAFSLSGTDCFSLALFEDAGEISCGEGEGASDQSSSVVGVAGTADCRRARARSFRM